MSEELVLAGVAVVAKVIKNVLIRRQNAKRKVRKGKFRRIPSIGPGYLKMVERQARDLEVWVQIPIQVRIFLLNLNCNFSRNKLSVCIYFSIRFKNTNIK